MTRGRWIALVGVVLIALFAVVVGGFLWPRPQFRRGPWAVPPDSVGTAVDSMPGPARP